MGSSTKISTLRTVSQVLFFFIVVFGGFFIPEPLDLSRGEVVAESGYKGSFDSAPGVRWVEREKMALRTFLPVTSCYYQHNGLFNGCSLLFLSENITWLSPLFHVLPHLALLLALMFTFGRLWCGWICPFGLLSDVLTWIRRALGVDHRNLPRRWRDGLVYTKYTLLFATLALAILGAVPAMAASHQSFFLPFCQVCLGKFASPFLSFATICWTNFSDWITGTLSVLGLLTLGAFFLGFTIRRMYCRICPIGGITAPFNRYGLMSLQKDARRCTRCGACARVCPVDNLTVYEGQSSSSVDACECTLCLRCVDACPEEGCLKFTFIGKRITGS